MESSKTPNKAIIGIVVVVLIAIIATVVIAASNNGSTTDNAFSASTTPLVGTPTNTSTTTATNFKDGTYSANGSYQTPGGTESIDVSVTLSSGTITDAKVALNARGGEAEEYQSKFASGFKSQVVGKKINEVSLTRVAGSSLTPKGFNSAIADIENQAKA